MPGTGRRSRAITRCRDEAILLSVLPEAGAPVVGVDNQFYVVTSYPDGSPAPATVRLSEPLDTTIRTDANGIGAFFYTPPQGAVTVSASATDLRGLHGSFHGLLKLAGRAVES